MVLVFVFGVCQTRFSMAGRGGSLYTKPLGGFFSRFGTSICYSSGRMAWASWATLLCLVAKTIALAIVVETAIGGFGRLLWRDNRMNQSGVLRILKKLLIPS
jgi:hypothetical protein